MASMLHRSRSRLVALIVGFSLLIMLMVSSIAPAVASPSSSVDTYYFSNASMTKQVGESHLSCAGVFVKKGKITPYFISTDDPCS